jgi:hypothetical protein
VALSSVSAISAISARTDHESMCQLTQNWHNSSHFVRAPNNAASAHFGLWREALQSPKKAVSGQSPFPLEANSTRLGGHQICRTSARRSITGKAARYECDLGSMGLIGPQASYLGRGSICTVAVNVSDVVLKNSVDTSQYSIERDSWSPSTAILSPRYLRSRQSELTPRYRPRFSRRQA